MELLSDKWTWVNFDDFLKKYGPEANSETWERFRFLFAQIDRMGLLVNWGLIDPERLHRWGGGSMIELWEKFEPIIVEWRLSTNMELKGSYMKTSKIFIIASKR